MIREMCISKILSKKCKYHTNTRKSTIYPIFKIIFNNNPCFNLDNIIICCQVLLGPGSAMSGTLGMMPPVQR